MTLEQIKELDGQIVDSETFEAVEESEHVLQIDDNGLSGKYYNKHWYSVFLVDGEEIQLYL